MDRAQRVRERIETGLWVTGPIVEGRITAASISSQAVLHAAHLRTSRSRTAVAKIGARKSHRGSVSWTYRHRRTVLHHGDMPPSVNDSDVAPASVLDVHPYRPRSVAGTTNPGSADLGHSVN